MFGWGTSSKTWNLADGRQIVYRYSYFHIVYLFRISHSERWFLVGDNRSNDREISFEEASRLIPHTRPRLNLWLRYGLLFTIGAFVLLGLLGIG